MAAATKTRDMTTGSPLGHIIAFTIPVFMSVLFQQFYSIADSMIVGAGGCLSGGVASFNDIV